MRTFTTEQFDEIIQKHSAWLNDEEGGERADLRSADLRSAASIWGAVGNLSQIKSVQCDLWPVTYTADEMQIGCQFHTLTEWWAFSEEEIQEMDSRASAWWAIWKPILKTIIEASPAVPYEAPEKGAD